MKRDPGTTDAAAGAQEDARGSRLWRLLRIRRGFVVVLASVLAALWWWTIEMPGSSYRGALPPLTEAQRLLERRLRSHVHELAETIGARSLQVPEGLERAARYIESELASLELAPRRQSFEVAGQSVANIEVEITGSVEPEQIVIVGAHYDGVHDRPAANDNGSGSAALLALAELRAGRPARRTLRLVFFVNEEPPYFQSDAMGSLVHARRCRERDEDVRAMWSLETLGCYFDEPGSQEYPLPALRLFYPSRGDFVAFVGNTSSRSLVRHSLALFRELASFPSEGAALPGIVPGVGWSDHWSFWQVGYPAVMITDTAPFRDPTYHTHDDVADNLDYARLARVVDGLARVLDRLLEERD